MFFCSSPSVLINDTAAAEIQVADFGVAHLSRRQADVETAGAQSTARKLTIELGVEGSVGE